ncbi:MAG TPA: DUF2442 domain-containing protein [Gammaproteobacteria bacterium]|nr:DUF2442 domain-containing protein [Gammaproteobacteria bacterium]
MSSLATDAIPRAEHVRCTDEELVVSLTDGRNLSVPLVWFPRLAKASPSQRKDYELLGGGEGIYWPQIDEDISVAGLLLGRQSAEIDQTE